MIDGGLVKMREEGDEIEMVDDYEGIRVAPSFSLLPQNNPSPKN